MTIQKQEFRQALGQLASGVSVLTARLDDGRFAGITVTAFTSLSLEPPLVLVCIDKRARLHDLLAVGKHFAINMLAAEQEPFSSRFASSAADQFAGVDYSPGPGGSPLLTGCVAHLECRVVERLPGGDHTIVVGQVEHTTVDLERTPLLYWRGGYRRIG